MPESIRILYIVVNYRRAALCASLAQKVIALSGTSAVHALIVDNSETPQDRDFLKDLPNTANLSVKTPSRNLGFYGGADFALEEYLKGASLPDWTIVSNPDIDFLDGGFVNTLLSIVAGERIGVLAPDIRLAPTPSLWDQGLAQNPLMENRPSRNRLHLLEIMHRSALLYLIATLRHRAKLKRSLETGAGASRAIYAPHGSAVIFSRNYFERGGTLKHGTFLYGEELFVAEELRKRDLSCIFEPRLQLCHVGGVTTGALGSSRQRRYISEALRFIRLRYFSDSDFKNA